MTERLTPRRYPSNAIWRGFRFAYLTAFVWCLLAVPGRASAEVTRDELARHHFQAAKSHFEQSEYERALQGFEKAYELSMRPEILVSISLTHEKMKHFERAIAALDRFLILAADHPDSETVRARRNALRERLAAAPPPPPPKQAETPIRAKPEAGETPAPTPPPRERQAVTRRPEQEAVEPPPSAPVRWPAYLLLGSGGASLIGALTTSLFAEVEYDDLSARCAPRCSPDDAATGEAMQTAARVLGGVGVVTLGVGAWLWWRSAATPPEATGGASGPQLELTVGPRSGFAAATWRF